MPRLVAFLVAASLVPASAFGQDCKSAVTQTDMNICADKAFKKTDAELNAVYRQIMDRLNGNRDTANLLASAEKAWIGFRDAECAFEASSTTGGSVYPLILTLCLDGTTKKRVETLKSFLHCEEGDMSCPVPAAQ